MKKLLFISALTLVVHLCKAQTFNLPLAIEDGLLQETDSINFCNGTLLAINSQDVSINNKEYTLTICPDDENQFVYIENISVNWTGINLTQQGFSFEIFDGDSTDDALLVISTPQAVGIAEAVGTTAENATGCLTIVLKTATPALPPSFPAPQYGFSLDFKCHNGCQDITPAVDANSSFLCSSISSTTILVPVDEEVILFGSGFSSINSALENLQFNWLIEGESFEGSSVATTFQETGIVSGTLQITDEFLCESEPFPFFLMVSDDIINVSPQNETFSIDELISDILVGGGDCTNVSNIQVPVQSPNATSIGYFSSDCSAFPFSEGIVIGSGGIGEINGTTGNENNWSESSEEGQNNGPNEQILSILGGGQNSTNNVNDATVIEFEFSSFESNVSFNYIYASNEYTSAFPCNYADPFAFIVSGPGIDDENLYLSSGNPNNEELLNLGGLNVATITPPGITVPIPTTATNIHPGTGIFNCNFGSLGFYNYPEYFNQLQPPYHSLNGETNVLTASFEVIPCETYTLKLMVADWQDPIFNSFVFIEGGSFDVGVNLGEDLTPSNPSTQCFGEAQTLNSFQSELDNNCDLSIEWFFNGELLPDENNNSSINVTVPGLYEVFISGNETCNGGDQIVVEFLPVAEFTFPYESICACSSTNQFEIDLTDQLNPFLFLAHDGQGHEIPESATSLADLGMEVAYFNSEADALNFTNPIVNPTNFEVNASTNQVWVRVNEALSGNRNCPTIQAMDVVTENFDQPNFIANQVQDLDECNLFLESDSVDLTLNDAASLGSENPSQVVVSYHQNRVDAFLNQNSIANPESYTLSTEIEKIYARLENTETSLCFTIVSFDVALNTVKIGTTPLSNYYECKEENQTSNFVNFNLRMYDAVVLGSNQSPSTYRIDYFTSSSNASNFINPILNVENYLSTGETLWVRISKRNQVGECFETEQFELVVTEFGDPQCETFSVEDFEMAFNLYPNPTQEMLFIAYPKFFDVQQIEVVNINGKKVLSAKESLHEISFHEYPAGIYFVRILFNNYWIVKKVIKR